MNEPIGGRPIPARWSNIAPEDVRVVEMHGREGGRMTPTQKATDHERPTVLEWRPPEWYGAAVLPL